MQFRVGHIFTRCFVQKEVRLDDVSRVVPLFPTGFSGEIHDSRDLLSQARFSFTRADLERTKANFGPTGHAVLVELSQIEAADFGAAIESTEDRAQCIAGSISVLSANPAVPLCSFAEASGASGVKYYLPQDRVIRHGTNIGGFLDAVQDQATRAEADPKYELLLRLFRASLRESDPDHRLLFQLILLEEASDGESGSLADRIRGFADKHGFTGDLDVVASQAGIQLPTGKDTVDLLVKLRNCSAHNGFLSKEGLEEFGGGWAVPFLADKQKLFILLTEALRYMFCALVGHTRETMATKVTGSTEIKFD